MKYTEEELAELAKGVFKDDKTSPSIYVDENGTFRNSEQYEKLNEEKRAAFPFEFKNPNMKATVEGGKQKDFVVIQGEEITVAELEENIKGIIERAKKTTDINEELKSKAQDQETAIVDLKAEIERLNGLKSVSAVNEAKAEIEKLNATIVELNKKVAELSPQ